MEHTQTVTGKIQVPDYWREHLRQAGKAGGLARSKAKSRSSKRNGKLGGRPRKIVAQTSMVS